MKEFLPFAVGLAAGYLLSGIDRRWLRSTATVGIALIGGACASAINGELTGALWPIFVSVDALLVYLGVATSTVLLAAHVPDRLTRRVRR